MPRFFIFILSSFLMLTGSAFASPSGEDYCERYLHTGIRSTSLTGTDIVHLNTPTAHYRVPLLVFIEAISAFEANTYETDLHQLRMRLLGEAIEGWCYSGLVLARGTGVSIYYLSQVRRQRKAPPSVSVFILTDALLPYLVAP